MDYSLTTAALVHAMNAANHYATPAIGLVAVGVQEQAEDILVPPLLRNCLTLNYISTV